VRRWKYGSFPKVTVQFGRPLTFPVEANASRERQLEAAGQVFDEVKRMYGELATRSAARSGQRSPDRAQA
jgi:hypothetical protein